MWYNGQRMHSLPLGRGRRLCGRDGGGCERGKNQFADHIRTPNEQSMFCERVKFKKRYVIHSITLQYFNLNNRSFDIAPLHVHPIWHFGSEGFYRCSCP